jgi:hypothetical protein
VYAATVGVTLSDVSERMISIPLYLTQASTVLYEPVSIPIASVISKLLMFLF